jgi:hypothetical protein
MARMPRRAPREPSPWQPAAVAIILLTVFGVLMAGAGVAGWWDPAANEQAIGEVSRWCERVSGGLVREPLNTAGNLAFVFAGLAMFAVLARDTGKGRKVVNPFIGNQGIALLYASAATFLGPGSMLMHASHTFFGAWLDNLSMVIYILIPVVYNLALLGRWRARTFAIVYVTTVVLYAVGYWTLGPDLGINLELFEVCIPLWIISEALVRFPDPRFRWASGLIGFAVALAFGITPWAMITQPAEYWWVVIFWLPALLTAGPVPVRRSYLPWFWAGLVSFLTAFYTWNLGKDGTSFCEPDGLLQGHAIWHALSALATWCFFKFLRTQRFAPMAGAAAAERDDDSPEGTDGDSPEDTDGDSPEGTESDTDADADADNASATGGTSG